jgi:hypothetical protein
MLPYHLQGAGQRATQYFHEAVLGILRSGQPAVDQLPKVLFRSVAYPSHEQKVEETFKAFGGIPDAHQLVKAFADLIDRGDGQKCGCFYQRPPECGQAAPQGDGSICKRPTLR